MCVCMDNMGYHSVGEREGEKKGKGVRDRFGWLAGRAGFSCLEGDDDGALG